MKLEANSPQDLKMISSKWLETYSEPIICLISGEMGAGKTTFVKELCNALNVKETISSPTFSLVNEYKSETGLKIFHFDLYRLNSEEELYDMGFEEYLTKQNYVFIEWPAKGMAFYPNRVSHVNISLEGSKRVFSFD